MSKSNRQASRERFHFTRAAALWHHARNTESLGCQGCHYKPDCGGLRVEAGVFSCLTFCRCVDPRRCDNICPRNSSHLVARSFEVNGFGLMNAPTAPHAPTVLMPACAPLIYHSYSRERAPEAEAVALSLYALLNKKDGTLRFSSREQLVEHFRLPRNSLIILSGTDEDPPLERWWSLPDRPGVARRLRDLGVALMTTPNFSLFGDVPRLDNLYNMKRSALVWAETMRAGLPCALHINARVDRDWERWAQFLQQRPEAEWVACEFGTGAGAPKRIEWHVERLRDLARSVRRPLKLVSRGGINALTLLRESFEQVLFIDTASFVKAHKRQQATLKDDQLAWIKRPTKVGVPIDDLLDTNIRVVKEWTDRSRQSLSRQPT